MPHRNVSKKAKKQRYGGWDKTLKTLRKRYTVKQEDTIRGKGNKNTPLSFHMRNVVVGGRSKAHPLPKRLEAKRT
jgi:hypothetical protein